MKPMPAKRSATRCYPEITLLKQVAARGVILWWNEIPFRPL